ncbi:MAG: aminoglycoside 6-acetyltransferase [Devosia sp.]|nr:aminoglycoside 6-acetyltransferase [Devosia sp.]
MIIERVDISHIGSWSRLRHALWPRMSASEHERDIQSAFFDDAKSAAAFVAIVDGTLIGFAEASLRHDYVNGCETSPVAFLEGIYVNPDHRRHGVANALSTSVEKWGRDQGCVEFASDTSLDNDASQRLHAALGFEETQRVVFFRKRISM